MEAAKLLNKQALYVDQLEDTVSASKTSGELKTAERLIQTQRLTIDSLETNKRLLEEAGTAMLKNMEELRKEHHKNAVAQARAIRAMFEAKVNAENALQMLKATISHVF